MTDHQFEVGDRVRVDIPDETDPDYSRLHGRHGEIVAILRTTPAPSRAIPAMLCCIVFSWRMERKLMSGGAISGHSEVSF
jgi:hypothetical protein